MIFRAFFSHSDGAQTLRLAIEERNRDLWFTVRGSRSGFGNVCTERESNRTHIFRSVHTLHNPVEGEGLEQREHEQRTPCARILRQGSMAKFENKVPDG